MNRCLLHFLQFLARLHFLFVDFKAHEKCSVDAAEFAKIACFLIYGDL
jgi:hypothetical protein